MHQMIDVGLVRPSSEMPYTQLSRAVHLRKVGRNRYLLASTGEKFASQGVTCTSLPGCSC